MRKAALAAAVPVCLTVFVALALAGDGEKKNPKGAQERVAWVEKCLKDLDGVKPGMTRKEVAERLTMDGGLQPLGGPIRFAHRECGYFKVDVDFDFRRDPPGTGRAISSPDDKVTKTSKPYIARPVLD